eukprot:scaffold202317_cov18-Prasinocladus_malaysianus.AAC.1
MPHISVWLRGQHDFRLASLAHIPPKKGSSLTLMADGPIATPWLAAYLPLRSPPLGTAGVGR